MQDSPPVGAGATGQGKSVGLNAIITSLLYKKHPAELKFVMVDPKQVEFSIIRRSNALSGEIAECRQTDRDGAGGCGGDFELFGDRDGKSL